MTLYQAQTCPLFELRATIAGMQARVQTDDRTTLGRINTTAKQHLADLLEILRQREAD